MQFNRFGEYIPFQVIECAKDCGLCLKVCPFADGNPDEDSIGDQQFGSIPGILHRPETGYYLKSYVGFAEETRDRGSSGGMASWFLSVLLKMRVVDYIVAVVPNNDPDRLFKYAILSTQESVLDSAGSAYYPEELSEVLKEIQNRPGKCAIIALPCFIKAVRLAIQKNRKLKERIAVTVGLVCGQLKSKHYTDYISVLSGVLPLLQRVNYRMKIPGNPPENYLFSCINLKGDKGRIFSNEGVKEVWINRWFTLNGCNYCDDIFAECADITFMDAWLPGYSSDDKGTNLVLVRTPFIQEIIQTGINSLQLSLKHIPIQEIVRSQYSGIQEKKIHLSYRLYQARKTGQQVPMKRVAPASLAFHPFLRKEIELKEEMRITSRNSWIDHDSHEFANAETFRKMLNPCLLRLKQYQQISVFAIFPMKLSYSILRRLTRYFHE